MNLNSDQRKVLAHLADEEDGFWCFGAIMECVRLDRKAVRRACRALARKGLTQYGRGLWTDDGPYGSGYRITTAGRQFNESG
jgi:hypothetical protein